MLDTPSPTVSPEVWFNLENLGWTGDLEPGAKNKDGVPVLLWALLNAPTLRNVSQVDTDPVYVNMIEALVAAGAPLDACVQRVRVPRPYPAIEDDGDAGKVISTSVLMQAMQNQLHPEWIEAWLEHEVPMGTPFPCDSTLLIDALRFQPHLVAKLLKKGADLNERTLDGHTALMYAVTHAPAWVQPFIDAGAEVNVLNARGLSPLSRCKTPQTLALLLAAGADPNLKNEDEGDGSTHLAPSPLSQIILATAKSSPRAEEMVGLLLAAGAHPDLGGRYATPLSLAINQRNRGVMDLLIRQGASVNLPQSNGWTPLMIAAGLCETCTQVLLDHGALIQDNDVKCVMAIAAAGNPASLVPLLKAGGDLKRVERWLSQEKDRLPVSLENVEAVERIAKSWRTQETLNDSLETGSSVTTRKRL